MSIINVSEAAFERVVSRPGIVLVDYWASWCAPCRAFAPVFEKASQEHPDVVFAKVDTQAEPGLAEAARITAIPTLAVFKDGALVHSQAGALRAPQLEQLIGSVRALGSPGRPGGKPTA